MPSKTDLGAPEPLDPPYHATIPAMLRHIAEAYGDRVAHAGRGDRLTFRELERRSAFYARGLLAQGVTKGSRVALLMPNGPEFVAAFLAAARVGALVTPLSTLYQAPELRWVLNHADIQVLLTQDAYLRHDYLTRLETALPSLRGQPAGRLVLPEAPYLRSVLVWGEGGRDWSQPGPQTLATAVESQPQFDDALLAAVEANVTPADLACMIHTSGSTAEPKAVVHAHGPLIRHSYRKAMGFYAFVEGDVLVGVRPFFWVAGLAAGVFQSLQAGRPLYTADNDSAAAVIDLIDREGANAIYSSEAWIAQLNADPDLAEAGYEVLRIGADSGVIVRRTPAGLEHLNPARAKAEPHPVHREADRIARTYGMTETLSAHTSTPRCELLPPGKPRVCGRPMPGIELRIVDLETREPLPPGQAGEVEVGGYSLMTGFYKRERHETFTRDGLYPTGDVMSQDEDGYLTFSHRIGDMIKVHGANVAPQEVEMALLALPQVARAAVVGLPDPAGGSVVVAAVEIRPGQTFDEAAIRTHLRSQLSSYKTPRRILALKEEELPLTGSGKILKSRLAPLLSARLQAEDEAAA